MRQLAQKWRSIDAPADVTGHYVPVWDLWIRLFHWSLVLAVVTAGATGFILGAQTIAIHLWAGAAISTLILARIVWGGLGGRFARFSGFMSAPRTVLRHLAKLCNGHAERHLGHNPLGGVMVTALLATLVGLAISGTIALGGVFHAGPLASFFNFDGGRFAIGLHEKLAYGLLALIGAHIAGALFESWRSRENLAKAMVTGRKEQRAGDHMPPPARSLPLVAVGVVLGILAATGVGWRALALRPIPEAPVAITGTTYAALCSDCHGAFHPSLLPAASWTMLMAGLGDHFGEDASVAPAAQSEITAFLVANAAGSTDTKPAHVFQVTDPARPTEITATLSWKRIHRRLADVTFTAPRVLSKANCAACHADAGAGWFFPGNINVPSPTKGNTP